MRDTGQRNGKPCILLVADDAALRTMLRYNLETQRYWVEEAEDGPRALARIPEVLPDLVILDWMLPVLSGIEICPEVRRGSYSRDVPILMISARTTEQDVVRGLDAGADDYVTKPLAMDTFLARIRALLRRTSGSQLPIGRLTFHDVRMDLTARRVSRAGRAIDLAPAEYRLLEFLMSHPGRTFARQELVNALWGQHARVEVRTVDVHVRRLRQALNGHGEPDLIRTVRTEGYAFDTEQI